jgi:predicted dehydrogenase
MTLNFENGTIYRNMGPLPEYGVGHRSWMSVVVPGAGGQPTIEHADLPGASGEYQWEAFARAVRGEKLPGQATPHEIVEGLKIITAMARSQSSGSLEAV